MKNFFQSCYLIIFLIVMKTDSLAEPAWLWTQGISSLQGIGCNDVTTDIQGNSYLTGSHMSIVDFDPGQVTFNLGNIGLGSESDAYVLKIDPAGNFVWAFSLGGSRTDEGVSITIDAAGDLYVLGQFAGTVDFDPGPGSMLLTAAGVSYYDTFILKIDAAGNFIWVKQIGAINNDYPVAITTDANLNVYATGYFFGTSDFDPGPGVFNLTSIASMDIFIVKLNSIGNFVWAVNMGGTEWDQGNELAIDALGNVFLTGFYKGTADMDPGPGVFNLISGINTGAFVCKLNSNGALVWAVGFSKSQGNSIKLDAASNVYLTGSFSDTVDFDPSPGVFNLTSTGGNSVFVSKLDSSGNFIWAKAMLTIANNYARGISLLIEPLSNDLLVGGHYAGTLNCDPALSNFTFVTNGSEDLFLTRFNSAGDFIWGKTAGGTGADYLSSIALTTTGNIYACGYSNSQMMSFDSLSLVSNLPSSPIELFVAKLDNIITGVSVVADNIDITMYPNPVTDILYVSIPVTGAWIKITDMKGRVVYERVLLSSGLIEIPTGEFAEGVYMLNLFSERNNVMKKLIVNRF